MYTVTYFLPSLNFKHYSRKEAGSGGGGWKERNQKRMKSERLTVVSQYRDPVRFTITGAEVRSEHLPTQYTPGKSENKQITQLSFRTIWPANNGSHLFIA